MSGPFKIETGSEPALDETAYKQRGRKAFEGGATETAQAAFKEYADAYFAKYRVQLEFRFYDSNDKVIRFGKLGWPFGQNETVQRIKELTRQLKRSAWTE
jgi:hypothetical protein